MLEYIIIALSFSIAMYLTLYIKVLKTARNHLSKVYFIVSSITFITITAAIFPIFLFTYLLEGHEGLQIKLINALENK